jgi:hypothetical protein
MVCYYDIMSICQQAIIHMHISSSCVTSPRYICAYLFLVPFHPDPHTEMQKKITSADTAMFGTATG